MNENLNSLEQKYAKELPPDQFEENYAEVSSYGDE